MSLGFKFAMVGPKSITIDSVVVEGFMDCWLKLLNLIPVSNPNNLEADGPSSSAGFRDMTGEALAMMLVSSVRATGAGVGSAGVAADGSEVKPNSPPVTLVLPKSFNPSVVAGVEALFADGE